MGQTHRGLAEKRHDVLFSPRGVYKVPKGQRAKCTGSVGVVRAAQKVVCNEKTMVIDIGGCTINQSAELCVTGFCMSSCTVDGLGKHLVDMVSLEVGARLFGLVTGWVDQWIQVDGRWVGWGGRGRKIDCWGEAD